MSVQFRNAATGAYIQVQDPERGDALEIDLHQVLNFTADGELDVYELGVTSKVIRLAWSELRASEKSDLESFWQSTAQGGKTLFLYRDHAGAWWNARFLNPKLVWTCNDDYTLSQDPFVSGGTTYSSTLRTAAVWGVELELLLTAAGSTTA